MSSGVQPEAWEVLPWDNPEANPLEDLKNAVQILSDHDFLSEDLDTEKEGKMKYANLQQARRLVEGFSPKERDLILPFLPTLPEQKTFGEILECVYEAYMDEEDEANSDRLDEIHYQLENWIKITPARETAFSTEEYERLPHKSVVLDEDIPWVKWSGAWFSAFDEVRSNSEMAGEPRKVIRKGHSYVQ